MSNINRSDELIQFLTKQIGRDRNATALAYAQGFGLAWAMLTDEQRQFILDYKLGDK